MVNKYRANATDIWKRPMEIRYIWYVEVHNEKSYVGATWYSLKKAIDKPEVSVVKAIDIIDDEVINLTINNIEDFMEQWRDNYHNPNWKFKK